MVPVLSVVLPRFIVAPFIVVVAEPEPILRAVTFVVKKLKVAKVEVISPPLTAKSPAIVTLSGNPIWIPWRPLPLISTSLAVPITEALIK